MICRIGRDFAGSWSYSTVKGGLDAVRDGDHLHTPGEGSIWVLHSGAWRLVGNYTGTTAWNGLRQIMRADETELEWLARHI